MSNDARARLELAEEQHRRGDAAGAIATLREAAAAHPGASAIYKNLSALLWQSGRIAEARDALAAGVAALPGDAMLWSRLARCEIDLGRAEAGFAAAARAEQAGPADAGTWAMIGGINAEFGRWPEAGRALARAAALDPGDPEIELRLAHALQEAGDNAQALQALARGAARDPGHLNVAIDERLYLPQVYGAPQDPARWRERYSAGLARLHQELPKWSARAREALEVNHHNFLLAYQGEDDLELQRGYSRLLASLSRVARPEWFEPRPRRFDGARRLRVGFASVIFRDCTAGRYFERWVTGLDPKRFERFVYHTAPLVDDFTRRIAHASEHFVPMRLGNAETAARIAADELDVLIQPEVGMTPMSYMLAGLRLAPVQVAGWGHPVTTGSDNMDYYLTCAAMEPGDGAAHYAEKLIALPGLGVDYAMPTPPAPAARAAVGLPEGRRLYICPQSLFKIHPEMDALFARLIEADPGGLLLFFQSPARGITAQFGRRVQAALSARAIPPRGQVKFLPRVGPADFRRLLALADVVVDTVRWSGGNTSLDALAAGTPIVTLPGRFMRGRQTAAMLRMIGLGELVARDEDDYVRLAVEAARDRDRNAALRSAIVANRVALFDRREPIVALEDALATAAAG